MTSKVAVLLRHGGQELGIEFAERNSITFTSPQVLASQTLAAAASAEAMAGPFCVDTFSVTRCNRANTGPPPCRRWQQSTA